jgi:hypothetical protein
LPATCRAIILNNTPFSETGLRVRLDSTEGVRTNITLRKMIDHPKTVEVIREFRRAWEERNR